MFKKTLIFLVAFGFGSSIWAETTLTGSTSSKLKTKRNTQTDEAVHASYGVDADGNSGTGMRVSFPNDYSPPAAWPSNKYDAVATVTSITAHTLNITDAAGTSGDCIYCISVYDGTGPAATVIITDSATPPTTMDGINVPSGGYVEKISGWQCFAAGPGDHAHVISYSTGDVEINEKIDLMQ